MDVMDEITKGREDALDIYDTELRRTSAETAGETDDRGIQDEGGGHMRE